MFWRDGHGRLRAVHLDGATVLERSSDELLRWVPLRLSDGRQLLVAERTYRDGTKVLVEPTGGSSKPRGGIPGGMELRTG